MVHFKLEGGKLVSKNITATHKGLKKTSTEAKKAQTATRSLSGSMSALKAALPIAGVAVLAKSFVDAASEAEQYRVRLNILLGSQQEGNRMFKEMAEYASKVPFEYRDVMNAATSLAGVMEGGVDEVKRWMPLIGDLAATTGISLREATSQVIRMYSAGAQAAEMFKERGITQMMGFKVGVSYSAQETREMMMREWNKADSQFKGATESLAETWQGKVSMLQDAWFNFQVSIMEGGLLDYFKDVVDELTLMVRWISTGATIGGRLGEIAKLEERQRKLASRIETARGLPGHLTEGSEYLRLMAEWNKTATALRVMRDYVEKITPKRGERPEAPLPTAGGMAAGVIGGARARGFRGMPERAEATPIPQMGLGISPLPVQPEAASIAEMTYQQIYDSAEGFRGKMIPIMDDIAMRLPTSFEHSSMMIEETLYSMTDLFGGAFEVIGSGAKDAGDAILKSMLGTLGKLAFMHGQYLFMAGTGWSFIPGGQMAAGSIPWGLALMALGGTLKGMSSGMGGGGGYGAGGGGGYRAGIGAPAGRREEGGGGLQVVLIMGDGRPREVGRATGERMIDKAVEDRILARRIKEMYQTGEAFKI